MGEFELIERFFTRPVDGRVDLGIGDDCALLQPAPGQQLAVSSDMLVEGRHFLSGANPERLGHKALAVNLSDLAACGARPLAFTLALALPRVDEEWLGGFSRGLFALADQHACALIGGDTTAGPLNICITVFGEVALKKGRSQALLRSGAQAGDDIYLSGTVGDARCALDMLLGRVAPQSELLARLRPRLEQPTPRVALGLALRGIASAAIDLSDGLLGDLEHLLRASGVGACVDTAWVMGSSATSEALKSCGEERALACALAGGDDYELLFTAPSTARAAVLHAASQSGTPVTMIGRIEALAGLRLTDAHGELLVQRYPSFEHFA